MKGCHFLLFFAAAVLLTGCANSVNTIENADRLMVANVIEDVRFVTDNSLNNNLLLTDVVTSYTEDGFLRVQVEAFNACKILSVYKIRYKFTWYDAEGMTMDTILSDWRTKEIRSGETVSFQSVAPRKDCKDFRISVQKVD